MPTETKPNERKDSSEAAERAELARREADLRKREREAVRTEAGLDDREWARIQLTADVLADAIGERLEEFLEELSDGAVLPPKKGDKSGSGGRDRESEGERRRFRII